MARRCVRAYLNVLNVRVCRLVTSQKQDRDEENHGQRVHSRCVCECLCLVSEFERLILEYEYEYECFVVCVVRMTRIDCIIVFLLEIVPIGYCRVMHTTIYPLLCYLYVHVCC